MSAYRCLPDPGNARHSPTPPSTATVSGRLPSPTGVTPSPTLFSSPVSPQHSNLSSPVGNSLSRCPAKGSPQYVGQGNNSSTNGKGTGGTGGMLPLTPSPSPSSPNGLSLVAQTNSVGSPSHSFSNASPSTSTNSAQGTSPIMTFWHSPSSNLHNQSVTRGNNNSDTNANTFSGAGGVSSLLSDTDEGGNFTTLSVSAYGSPLQSVTNASTDEAKKDNVTTGNGPSAENNGMLSELVFSSRNFASVSVGERSFNAQQNNSQLCQSISLSVKLNLNPYQLAQKLAEKLIAAHGDRTQRNVLVQEEDIKIILSTVHSKFMSEPMLIEVNGPLKICGDIHGQFYDLLRIFERCGFPSGNNAYLFLGDYVDRGRHSIETLLLLFCYKILHPQTFTLLRGNHECASINKQYGFFDDVKRRYNIKLFRVFTGVFDTMPICAVVSSKIICMHGGLSPDLGNVQMINQISRPCDVPHEGIMCDLLWSDPSDDELVSGFLPSSRGVGWEFGRDMVEAFLDHVDMDLIVRGHQVQERGYGFFASRQLVSIFSAPGYCGEFDNDAAVMNVDAKLQCSFTVIPPRQLFW